MKSVLKSIARFKGEKEPEIVDAAWVDAFQNLKMPMNILTQDIIISRRDQVWSTPEVEVLG